MEKGFFVYAWDLAEEGPKSALEKIQELGANTVCLASSYHAGKFTRPRAKQKIYFPVDGTVYFEPNRQLYGSIQPKRNPVLDQYDFFRDWSKYNKDLRLKAWTVCTHNSPQGLEHPEICVRNAFGDPYIYNLCPANDEVQHYVRALCQDLASIESVECITLETPGYLPFWHGYHHEFGFVPLDFQAQALLALCFSADTKRKAISFGVNAERLQNWVVGRLNQFFASGVYPKDSMAMHWFLADLIQEPDLVAYLRAQEQIVSELIKSVRDVLPKHVRLNLIPTVQRPTAGCWVEGTGLTKLSEIFDGVDSCAYQNGAEEIFMDSWDVRRRVGDEVPLSFILRPAPPDLDSKAQLLSAVEQLKTLQPCGISFYNYGFLPEPNLLWAQEAFALLD